LVNHNVSDLNVFLLSAYHATNASSNDGDDDDIVSYIYKIMSSTANPENYLVPLQFYRKEILKIAEDLFVMNY
jgi:hypothetical protein